MTSIFKMSRSFLNRHSTTKHQQQTPFLFSLKYLHFYLLPPSLPLRLTNVAFAWVYKWFFLLTSHQDRHILKLINSSLTNEYFLSLNFTKRYKAAYFYQLQVFVPRKLVPFSSTIFYFFPNSSLLHNYIEWSPSVRSQGNLLIA